MLLVHQLAHLILILLIAGHLGNEMAKRHSVSQVCEARDDQAAWFAERIDPIDEALPLVVRDAVLVCHRAV